MKLTRPTSREPILAVLLAQLVEVPTHYRKDRGGTVACQPRDCIHCRKGYPPAPKWYGPAALVGEVQAEQTDPDLEVRIAAAKVAQARTLEGLSGMARAHAITSDAHLAANREVMRLRNMQPKPVKSWPLIPYPSRCGVFLPLFVVAEVYDLDAIENEPGAVIRWEKRGHTRASFLGMFKGELPAPFAWQAGLSRLIGVWWSDEPEEGEQPDTIKFPGRKIG